MVLVMHMRNGDAVTYSPSDAQAARLISGLQQYGFSYSNLTIDDGSDGQRLVNLAAVDWIEVKGVPSAAPTP
jgi:hypothetical protein